MPWNDQPSSPRDAYKAIIDQLVEQTTTSVSERLLREHGVYSNAPSQANGNALAASLTAQQRIVLADMLRAERVSAIHDVLANLTWWITTREVALTFRGQPMPTELSGMGLHADYIGRLDNWEWPSDDAGS